MMHENDNYTRIKNNFDEERDKFLLRHINSILKARCTQKRLDSVAQRAPLCGQGRGLMKGEGL